MASDNLGSPSARPAVLPEHILRTSEDRFQPRRGLDERHVGVLRRAIRGGDPLAPVLVWEEAGKPVVLDGHHRVAAYAAEDPSTSISVRWYEGDEGSALAEAVAANRHDTLSRTPSEKRDAAWRLTAYGGRSVRDVASCAGVSHGTTGSMKKAADALRGAGADPREHLRWDEARRAARALAAGEDDAPSDYGDEWQEQQALDWCDRLGKAFGKKPHGQPEVFARALEHYFGRKLPDLLRAASIDDYGGDEEDDNPDF